MTTTRKPGSTANYYSATRLRDARGNVIGWRGWVQLGGVHGTIIQSGTIDPTKTAAKAAIRAQHPPKGA